MIITAEEVNKRALANDTTWIESRPVESRLKSVVSNNTFDEPVVRYLWTSRRLRWNLARHQSLPPDIILSAAEKISDKRESSLAIIQECLRNQEISDNLLTQFIESPQVRQDIVLKVWEVKAERLCQLGMIAFFMAMIERDRFESKESDMVDASAIAIIRADHSNLPLIVNSFMKTNYPSLHIESIARTCFFEDEVIDSMRETLDELSFDAIMEQLVMRDNCTIHVKAKFLLSGKRIR